MSLYSSSYVAAHVTTYTHAYVTEWRCEKIGMVSVTG